MVGLSKIISRLQLKLEVDILLGNGKKIAAKQNFGIYYLGNVSDTNTIRINT